MEDSEDERHDDSDSAEPMPLREALIRDLLSSGCTSELKMQPAALTLSSILIRAFIQEAWHRAAAEASDDGDTEVLDEHLEKILPQLLLDFGP